MNVLHLLLFTTTLSGGTLAPEHPTWYQHLAKAQSKVKFVEKRNVRLIEAEPNKSTFDGRIYDRPASAQQVADWNYFFGTMKDLGELELSGRFKEGYDLVVRRAAERPEFVNDFRVERARFALLVYRNEEAYELLLQREPRQQFEYLLLAYASAAAGETYPGQAQYCADAYLEHFEIKYTSPPVEPVVCDDPKKVMSLAMLAMGMRGTILGPVAFRKALEADPLNYQAARELMEYYEDKDQTYLAYEVAAKQLPLLPDGIEKSRLEKRYNVLRERVGK